MHINHLVKAFPLPIQCIQTDNGAEFTNRFTTHRDKPTLFQVHLKQHGILSCDRELCCTIFRIVPYGDFMDIPALFKSGISHKREILHKGICFVFRKWEPLPPFTKMPYDATCIIRHFISFISQGIVIFILLSFPMHKALQCAKVIPGC